MSAAHDRGRIVVGLFVVLVGVLALADNLFEINTRRILEFWPAVFVVVGAVKMSQTRHTSGLIFGGLFVALGLLMTLNNIGWINFRLRDWWPLFIIAAGVGLIARDSMERRFRQMLTDQLGNPAGSAGLNAVAIMSGNRLTVTTQDFSEGEATAVMGSVQLDFRQASIQNQAHLRVFAFWGGVELKVPPDWQVQSRAIAIMEIGRAHV